MNEFFNPNVSAVVQHIRYFLSLAFNTTLPIDFLNFKDGGRLAILSDDLEDLNWHEWDTL